MWPVLTLEEATKKSVKALLYNLERKVLVESVVASRPGLKAE